MLLLNLLDTIPNWRSKVRKVEDPLNQESCPSCLLCLPAASFFLILNNNFGHGRAAWKFNRVQKCFIYPKGKLNTLSWKKCQPGYDQVEGVWCVAKQEMHQGRVCEQFSFYKPKTKPTSKFIGWWNSVYLCLKYLLLLWLRNSPSPAVQTGKTQW